MRSKLLESKGDLSEPEPSLDTHLSRLLSFKEGNSQVDAGIEQEPNIVMHMYRTKTDHQKIYIYIDRNF